MPCCDLHSQQPQLFPLPDFPSMPCTLEEEKGIRERRRPTLVLVSKFPTPGFSKTRLIPAFGTDFATDLAMGMLRDLLIDFAAKDTAREFRKVLVYAPPSAGQNVKTMLKTMGLQDTWETEPVREGTALNESKLTTILTAALSSARERERDQAVIFVGMDAPELPWSEVMNAEHAAKYGNAYICPASDGGYTLLGLPTAAGIGVFEGVAWSEEYTCSSQKDVLEEMGIRTLEGGTYLDVDDAKDVANLEDRAARGYLSEETCPQTLHVIDAYRQQPLQSQVLSVPRLEQVVQGGAGR